MDASVFVVWRVYPSIRNYTMHSCRLHTAAVLLACLLCGAAEGQSFGRWRVPSTPAQFFGYCYGPGHQVPMVRLPGHINDVALVVFT